MSRETELEAKLKLCWCDKCDDYREPKPKRWETSKAEVIDYVCSVCGEVLLRIPRHITFKVPEPPIS